MRLLTPAFLLMIAGTAMAQKANYDESKVPKFELPDPLVHADGTPVKDPADWTGKRRPEIYRLFETHVFGTRPESPKDMTFDLYSDEKALDGAARRKQVKILITGKKSGPTFDLLIYLPGKAKGPVPAFLTLNFRGNHSIHPDPGITLNPARKEQKRGERKTRWAVEKVLARGYALATIYYGDIDPDKHDGFKNGVHALYPELQGRGDNFASIGAWAWGLSRALDYLETDKDVDAKRVAVMGHSRLGKTALWAGASDTRFALTISNNSGCGGAALSRRRFGESVRRINTSFPHWFCANHKKYNDNENACPVDHHMLIALMAPRPVYVASAEGDRWADPRGEFLSAKYATPVYKLFGKEGLPAKEFPAVNQPSHGTIGYHIRTGKHDVTDYDWERYLEFADKHLKLR